MYKKPGEQAILSRYELLFTLLPQLFVAANQHHRHYMERGRDKHRVTANFSAWDEMENS